MSSGNGLQSTTSCGSQNTTMQSQSALPADAITFDKQHTMWWHMLSRPEQLNELKAVATAHKAVDMLWFVHGLQFHLTL